MHLGARSPSLAARRRCTVVRALSVANCQSRVVGRNVPFASRRSRVVTCAFSRAHTRRLRAGARMCANARGRARSSNAERGSSRTCQHARHTSGQPVVHDDCDGRRWSNASNAPSRAPRLRSCTAATQRCALAGSADLCPIDLLPPQGERGAVKQLVLVSRATRHSPSPNAYGASSQFSRSRSRAETSSCHRRRERGSLPNQSRSFST